MKKILAFILSFIIILPLFNVCAQENGVSDVNNGLINISDYCTGLYLYSMENDTKPIINEYTSLISGGEYMLSMDRLKPLIENGYLKGKYSDYDISHFNTVKRAVFTNKCANNAFSFFPQSGYYGGVAFTAFNSKNTDINEFPVTVKYDDGETVTKYVTLNQGSGALSEDKQNLVMVNLGKVHADVKWASTGESTTGKNEIEDPVEYPAECGRNGYGYIYEYAVNFDSDKRIVSVSMGNSQKSAYILSVSMLTVAIDNETLKSEINKFLQNDSNLSVTNLRYIDYITYLISNLNNSDTDKKILKTYYTNGEDGLSASAGTFLGKGDVEGAFSLDGGQFDGIDISGYYRKKALIERKLAENSNTVDIETSNSVSDLNGFVFQSIGEVKFLLKKGINVKFCFSSEYSIGNTVSINDLNLDKNDGKVIFEGKNNATVTGGKKLNVNSFTKLGAGEKAVKESARNNIYIMRNVLDGIPKENSNYIGDIFLTVNGERQNIASYPNGGWAYFDELYNGTLNESGHMTGSSFYYKEDADWSGADQAYITGYISNDYAMISSKIASIDGVNKIINLESEKASLKYPNRRFKINNLPQEIDSEGEWFYDRSDNTLCYYTEDINKAEDITIVTRDTPLFEIKNSSNIIFKNISFKNTRCEEIKINGGENIEITGCTFETSSIFSLYAYNVYKFKFSGNTVRNTAAGIYVNSGDFVSLTPSGNKITNNLFYNIGYNAYYGRNLPVWIWDCGAEISHNTIYNTPFHGINYYGNDNIISYNEIFNVCNQVNDAAAIYSNAMENYAARGSVVKNNFIHNITHGFGFDSYVPEKSWNFEGVYGIYLDDALSGQTVENNIIADTVAGINVNAGQSNKVLNNIFCNTESDGIYISSYMNGLPSRIQSFTESYNKYIVYPAYAKYTDMKNPAEDPYVGCCAYNTAKGNLVVKSNVNITRENVNNEGIFENNTVTDSENMFVKENIFDFRIKSDSIFAIANPLLPTEISSSLSDYGADESLILAADKELSFEVAPKGEYVIITVNDALRTGKYIMSVNNTERIYTENKFKVNLADVVSDRIKIIRPSTGLKINQAEKTNNTVLSSYKVQNFYIADENGYKEKDVNTLYGKGVSIKGEVYNKDSKASVFAAVYTDNYGLNILNLKKKQDWC